MTEHKFTDEEIIRVLECCVNGTSETCLKCVLALTPYPVCKSMVEKHALDLINRQKAEIEELTTCNERQKHAIKVYHIGETRAEAIKEFAYKLKEKPIKYGLPLLGLQTKDEIEEYFDGIMLEVKSAIDDLVKEMTGGMTS